MKHYGQKIIMISKNLKLVGIGNNAKHKVKKSKDDTKPEIDFQGEKIKK